MENNYKQFIHPARLMDFDKLREGLQDEVDAGYVNCQTDETLGLEIYKYSNSCVYDKHWNEFTLIARGLILAPKEKEVVATPFPKFFNFGEINTDLPDEPFDTFEKVDGSLGIIFYWRGHWCVATCLSFTSEQSRWAEKWLQDNIPFWQLHVSSTYLSEIVYPENRIVVPYDYSGLVLLGIYDKFGQEVAYDFVKSLADHSKFGVASRHQYNSVDDILKICKTLPATQEGFVVRFANGYRVKIKGDDYCRIHRLISRCTPLAVWEAMCECDDLDALKKDLPEEFGKDLDNIRGILFNKYKNLLEEIWQAYNATVEMSDCDLGMAIQSGKLPFSRMALSYVFPCRKGSFCGKVSKPGKIRRSLFKRFRPTANVLEGYVPSTAINRFEEENTNDFE